MKTIETRAHIGADGVLHLNLPINLPETDVEVLVVVQPLPQSNGYARHEPNGSATDETAAKGWPPGFLETVIGGWQGEMLTRPDQGEYEVREELE